MNGKPYAESCEQNRAPILAVLKTWLTEPGLLLEIGSGTGQHAAGMAGELPHLRWQPTDVAENLPGIRRWRDDSGCENILEPLELDVAQTTWPIEQCDYVFTANTCHIMSWPLVCRMFEGVCGVIRSGGLFLIYGPFNYHGQYTAASNARFDQWLKTRDPDSGIRDIDELLPLAARHHMTLEADIEMPVNNRILVWRHR